MGKQVLTDLEVKGYIDVDGGIKDRDSTFGNSGQFLQTNGSDVVWGSPPGQGGNSTFVGKWSKTITWGTAQTGVSFSGANDKTCSLTHNLATEAVIVSLKDISGSSGYSDNDLHMQIGYDAFIEVNSPNIVRLEVEPTGASYPSAGDQFLVTVIG
jgi:hypothetical protein